MKTKSWLSPDMKMNYFSYFNKALAEINANPSNHGFPPEEVERVMEFSKQVAKELPRLKSQLLFEAFSLHPSTDGPFKHLAFRNTTNLSELGWYISPRIFSCLDFHDSMQILKKENIHKLEDLLLEKSTILIPEIIADCSALFPEREEIFAEISGLLELGFYRAVVMACYAQADGMSNDLWETGFFDKDRVYQLKALTRVKSMDKGMVTGIASQMGVASNEITTYSGDEIFSDSEKRRNTFNRHFVMHGHSIGYGSKINAVRAIYMLDFLQYIIRNNLKL